MDQLLGVTIDGRFRIVEHLGQRVYRGVQLSIDRAVAIKLIGLDGSLGRDELDHTLAEARQLTSIDHPNLTSVIDVGRFGGHGVYVVMELLRGTTLSRELARTGAFTTKRACEVMRQVTCALAAAHARGISHRDLHPDNIALLDVPGSREVVKVRDFALASPRGSGRVPFYLAPEAIAAGSVDTAIDVYAAGCILFEMLVGRQPFTSGSSSGSSGRSSASDHAPGATLTAILAKHMVHDAPRLPADVPAQLQPLVDAMLAKTSERRPRASHASSWLASLLDGVAAHEDPDQAATMYLPKMTDPVFETVINPSAPAITARAGSSSAREAVAKISLLPIILALALLAGSWWFYTQR